jgi:hypothetical protein
MLLILESMLATLEDFIECESRSDFQMGASTLAAERAM